MRPDRRPLDGKCDGPVPYVSQAPQAVRSAGGRRRDRALSAAAPAGGTLHPDKRDAIGLPVQVHGLRNISRTAAVRAVVRSQSLSPSCYRRLSPRAKGFSLKIVLRYESRTKCRIPLTERYSAGFPGPAHGGRNEDVYSIDSSGRPLISRFNFRNGRHPNSIWVVPITPAA